VGEVSFITDQGIEYFTRPRPTRWCGWTPTTTPATCSRRSARDHPSWTLKMQICRSRRQVLSVQQPFDRDQGPGRTPTTRHRVGAADAGSQSHRQPQPDDRRWSPSNLVPVSAEPRQDAAGPDVRLRRRTALPDPDHYNQLRSSAPSHGAQLQQGRAVAVSHRSDPVYSPNPSGPPRRHRRMASPRAGTPMGRCCATAYTLPQRTTTGPKPATLVADVMNDGGAGSSGGQRRRSHDRRRERTGPASRL